MSRRNTIEQGLMSAISPVDPKKFTADVSSYLQGKGVLVSQDTPLVIERLCRLFNYSITNPKIGGLLNNKNILIYPAQTGIGKSISIQHYVAALEDESSLIVVNTINEAREYCERINTIRQQNNYAMFSASKNTKSVNQLTDMDIVLGRIQLVQCLVITNNMFKKLLRNDNPRFRLYSSTFNSELAMRSLVVIDERLQFITKRFLKFNKLEAIAKFLKYTAAHSPRYNDDKKVIQQFESVQAIIDVINEGHSDERASHIDKLSIEPKLEDQGLPIRIDFEETKRAVAARIDEINEEVSILKPSGISNIKDIKNEVVDALKAFIDVTHPNQHDANVYHTGGEEVYREFAIYNKDLYWVKNIYNQFGTSIVLDATAEVNKYYKVAADSNSHIEIIDAPKIRKYNNLKIYKAKGCRQSAKAITGGDKNNFEDNVKFYGNIVKEILGAEDKILVITFKKFLSSDLHTLEDELAGNSQVELINWGKHVGQNKWSNFNKVILIGWLRVPEEESVSKLLNISSLGSSDIRTMKHVTPENVKKLQQSEIADDLIQGAMRCCARVIDTIDSDCKPASIYVFQDVLEGSDEVMGLFETEFPGAKIIDWKPKTRLPKSFLSLPDQKKEDAIEHLQELAESCDTYSRSKFCQEYNVPAATMSRWLKSGYFKERLEEVGFRIEKPQGKPERFIFR